MSKSDYYNIILEYMRSCLDRIDCDIQDIKNRKFYSHFDEDDYYKMLVLQVKYETLSDSFNVIREFLYLMQKSDD